MSSNNNENENIDSENDQENELYNTNLEENTYSINSEHFLNENDFHNYMNGQDFYNYDYERIIFPTININSIPIRENIEPPSQDVQNLFYNILNNFMDRIEEQLLEDILQESLNNSSTLEKNNDGIKFNKNKYNSINNDLKEKNKGCSICLTDFEEEDDISIINCNHLFHNNCIEEWTKYKKDCPICRDNIE
jgi:hypothetical protein